jgi:hypothetical protein
MKQRWVFWLVATASVAAATGGYAQSKATPNAEADTLYQNDTTKLAKSNKMWEQNDVCGKESFRKFPDFTAEASASRDAYMRDCLRKHHLPPRNDAAQPLGPRP